MDRSYLALDTKGRRLHSCVNAERICVGGMLHAAFCSMPHMVMMMADGAVQCLATEP